MDSDGDGIDDVDDNCVWAWNTTHCGDGDGIGAICDDVDRLWGTNRYGTAAAVSRATLDGAGEVFIALGTNFPDALVAGSCRWGPACSRPAHELGIAASRDGRRTRPSLPGEDLHRRRVGGDLTGGRAGTLRLRPGGATGGPRPVRNSGGGLGSLLRGAPHRVPGIRRELPRRPRGGSGRRDTCRVRCCSLPTTRSRRRRVANSTGIRRVTSCSSEGRRPSATPCSTPCRSPAPTLVQTPGAGKYVTSR